MSFFLGTQERKLILRGKIHVKVSGKWKTFLSNHMSTKKSKNKTKMCPLSYLGFYARVTVV